MARLLITIRIDGQKRKAVGVTVTNFDVRYAKLASLIGTKNEDLVEGQVGNLSLQN